jgi:glycosyltransferase involved in cell wall biosynthesis
LNATNQEVVHIGFVTGDGGDAIQIMELSAELIRKGWSARIVVPQLETTGAFVERCHAQGIPAEQSDAVRADILGAQQNVFKLIWLFWRHRHAMLHLHTGDVCLPRRVLFALGVVRPRHVVVTIQSPYDYLLAGEMRSRIWTRAVTHSIRKVICPSRHCYEAQLKCGTPADRALMIRNCVDVRKYSSGDPRRAFGALSLPENTPLVVFSARMNQQKRPIDALRAFLCVESEFPQLHLAFVGAGPDVAVAQEMARNSEASSRIHFAGFQRNIQDWLAAASIWILPTESENFSLAVLEALAAGTAIVSTQCPGNDEVLVDHHNALLANVGDVTALACAMRRLLLDDKLRRLLCTEARKTADEHGLEQMAGEVIQCYESVLADHPH